MGLLLLRSAAGLTALAHSATYLANSSHQVVATWIVGAVTMVGGALLVVGFLTPVAGAVVGLCGVGLASSLVPSLTPAPLDDGRISLFTLVVVAAVVLLGPGAYSLDARLFGRREIVIRSDRTGSDRF